ncbi:hypothetical protein [Oceanithermus sp.]
MAILRWLFALLLLAATLLLLWQALAPAPPSRRRRIRRALAGVLRHGRRLPPAERRILAEARKVAAALEELDARERELQRFLQADDLDPLARRRLEEHRQEVSDQLEAGLALLERLAAHLWAGEGASLPPEAYELAGSYREARRALHAEDSRNHDGPNR